ncbi:MAG TPA: nuclear transport factor 2 family protein [Thermoanaerobaculia bacterium]|jgi:uncharacterized protein (TIGR02246 family)|nr:nuclear transport factor 2 family protein [Thermoanaerobaculia bacterium]
MPIRTRTAAVLLALLSLLAPFAVSAEEPSPEAQVAALLRTQSEAWSRGDLEAFTSVYAEDAAFLSPSGLTRGRREVLERYRKRYPDAAAMGKLTLEVLETRLFPQGKEAAGASVAARWRLEYPGQADRKTAEGLTLIVLRRTAKSWEIVHDASM